MYQHRFSMDTDRDEADDSSPSETLAFGLIRQDIRQLADEIRKLQRDMQRLRRLIQQTANQLALEEQQRQQAERQRDQQNARRDLQIRTFMTSIERAVQTFLAQQDAAHP